MATLIHNGEVIKVDWKKLYQEELKDNPHLAYLLNSKDGVRKILERARLSADETEAWKLKGYMSEHEVAQIMGRQLRTVKELLNRAEYKLKHLLEPKE